MIFYSNPRPKIWISATSKPKSRRKQWDAMYDPGRMLRSGKPCHMIFGILPQSCHFRLIANRPQRWKWGLWFPHSWDENKQNEYFLPFSWHAFTWCVQSNRTSAEHLQPSFSAAATQQCMQIDGELFSFFKTNETIQSEREPITRISIERQFTFKEEKENQFRKYPKRRCWWDQFYVWTRAVSALLAGLATAIYIKKRKPYIIFSIL